MKPKTIKKELDQAWESFDYANFITYDPIIVTHMMCSRPEATIADIEICAIWTSMVAWGQREQIIKAATNLMKQCEWHPCEYIKLGDFYDIPDDECIYRTLKGKAFKAVCHEMRLFYCHHSSIQEILNDEELKISLECLMKSLCKWMEPARLGSPERNSACKRINMLLRWMVRKDQIDLGLWQTKLITPAGLFAIMDTHVAQQARKMGLISYPKESWKAVLELTHIYRTWDPIDPLKYDFVLMLKNLQK